MGCLNESRIGAVLTAKLAVRTAIAPVSSLHAQHSAGIFIGLDGDVTVTEPGGTPVRGPVVVLPPDLLHTGACPGPAIGIAYDPELMPHIASYARQTGKAFVLEARLARRLRESLTAHRANLMQPSVLHGVAAEFSTWLRDVPPRRPDRRVAGVLEKLREPSADRRLAIAAAGISEVHLQALFVRDVGLPIRTFLLWQRLLVALAALSHLNATEAAHAAGFADLAHFSRTCRRMIGHSPTTLRSGPRPT